MQCINNVAVAAYKALGIRDYGRVDLRVQDGIPYVLGITFLYDVITPPEINPNPCLYPSGVFGLTTSKAGYEWNAMIAHIAMLAWKRRCSSIVPEFSTYNTYNWYSYFFNQF